MNRNLEKFEYIKRSQFTKTICLPARHPAKGMAQIREASSLAPSHTRALKALNKGLSKVVVLGCNIYAQGYELMSCRGTRGRVRRRLKDVGN